MQTEAQVNPISVLKTLLDENRLKIMGHLVDKPATAETLSGQLKMKPQHLQRHLAVLESAGLIDAAEPDTYHFNVKALYQLKRNLFTDSTNPAPSPQTPEEKVMAAFVDGEQIKAIPTKWPKFLVILKGLVEKFEVGQRYSEKMVNERLQEHHPDYATLRRGLVDAGLMTREKGIYWRVDTEWK